MAGKEAYDSSEIRVLEGLEPVRLRPGMYIGSTGYDGLHHLIKEIADNSIDEAIAGYANRIDITILKDGGVRVDDNGRGIPVDIHPKTKSPLSRRFSPSSTPVASSATVVTRSPRVSTASAHPWSTPSLPT